MTKHKFRSQQTLTNYIKKRGDRNLSINQLADVDITQLSFSQARRITQRLASTANKRVRRLVRADIPSQALDRLRSIRGDFIVFTTKGVENIDDLLSEFIQIKNFVKSVSSTVRGATKQNKNIINIEGESLIAVEQVDTFWKLMAKVEEISPAYYLRKYDELARNISYELDQNSSEKDIIQKIQDELTKEYEKHEMELQAIEHDIEKKSKKKKGDTIGKISDYFTDI